MSIERERKFLVKKLPEDILSYPVLPIIQMYLVLTEKTQLRLRIVNFKDAFICYKETLSSTDKIEHEYRVSYNEAIAKYNKKDYECLLMKDRIPYKNWDIDIYPNGLTVAEYEYSDDNPFPDKLPDWIGEEITGKREYSNIYIAKNFDKFKNGKDTTETNR